MTYTTPGPPLKLSVVNVIQLVEPILPLWEPESQVKNFASFELILGGWSNCFRQANISTEIHEVFVNL